MCYNRNSQPKFHVGFRKVKNGSLFTPDISFFNVKRSWCFMEFRQFLFIKISSLNNFLNFILMNNMNDKSFEFIKLHYHIKG